MTGAWPVVPYLAVAAALVTLIVWLLGGVEDVGVVIRVAVAAAAAVLTTRLVQRMPGATGDEAPDRFAEVWWRAGQPSRLPDPPERGRLLRLVRLSMASAGDAHLRLRPLLRDLADARFDAVFGSHPDRDARAAERLGPAWAWVRPDRPRPRDWHAAGPGPEELDAVVTALERLDAEASGG